MYLFFANISSQNDRNDLSRNKLKSIFKFQYSSLPIETILALLNNSKGDAQSYYNCFACFLWKSSGLCFISCEGYYRVVMWMGFCKEEFPSSVSKLEGLSKTTWRPFWRYDWQRQQLDWLKGQRSELYFRMFIVKFSYHYDYERNKMYRLSPTFFFKTWTWRRFTTRFTRERGRTWKNSVTPYWGSGLAKTTWRPCWRDRLTVCPEGDLADWLLGQKWGHEWDDTLSWYLGKLISSFDKKLFTFQVYIWYLY